METITSMKLAFISKSQKLLCHLSSTLSPWEREKKEKTKASFISALISSESILGTRSADWISQVM